MSCRITVALRKYSFVTLITSMTKITPVMFGFGPHRTMKIKTRFWNPKAKKFSRTTNIFARHWPKKRWGIKRMDTLRPHRFLLFGHIPNYDGLCVTWAYSPSISPLRSLSRPLFKPRIGHFQDNTVFSKSWKNIAISILLQFTRFTHTLSGLPQNRRIKLKNRVKTDRPGPRQRRE